MPPGNAAVWLVMWLAASLPILRGERKRVKKHMARFIVQHRLVHGDQGEAPREYLPGETFESNDEQLVATLRKAHAILLPNEVEAAEDVARRQAELEAHNAALKAELEALRAAQAEEPKASESKPEPKGKAAKAEKAPEAKEGS